MPPPPPKTKPALAIPQTARERLIIALDTPGAAQALALVDRLEGSCQWYKVGLELYLSAGNTIVETLIGRGYSVFLDLKLHDIPNTVAGAIASVSRLGCGLLTVHAAGGPAMLRAAVEAAKQAAVEAAKQAALSHPCAPELLAVTVLTSMDAQQLHAIGVQTIAADQVEKLATLGRDCGIRGFVCSAQEVAAMRSLLGPEAILVTPGIRPGADLSNLDDQKRTATPSAAIRDGASYLVVGRPVTQAENPLTAATAILTEIESALGAKAGE